MKRRKFLLGSSAVLASGVLVSGSGAFSSTEVERGVTVEVVPDDEAYVGYEAVPGNKLDLIVSIGEWPEKSLVEVGNRLTGELSVTDVTVESGEIGVDVTTKPTDIPPGETDTIDGSLTSDAFLAKEKIGLTITVEGPGVTAKLDGDTIHREFTAIYISNPFGSLTAKHASQGQSAGVGPNTASAQSRRSVDAGDSVSATLEIADKEGVVETVSGTWTVTGKGSIDTELGDGYEIVSVELPRHGVVFEEDSPQPAVNASSTDEGFDPEEVLEDSPLDGFEVDD